MKRTQQFLALAAGGIGIAAALLGAPAAAAEPLLPQCETMGGSAVTGGQTTDCASPGNAQITATPNDLGIMGGEQFYGFPGFGFGF